LADEVPARRTLLATCLAAVVLAVPRPAQGNAPSEAGATRDPVASPGASAVFEGTVLAPDGAPARGAVVVSSAGGRAVTDASGRYRLEVVPPLAAEPVRVSALGSSGGNMAASTIVRWTPPSGPIAVPPLLLEPGTSCHPRWLTAFGGIPGTSDTVHALAVFDDGDGPALYAAGQFTAAGGAPANHVARWDGERWEALGAGMDSDWVLSTTVCALAVYDDGTGPSLYAAGRFDRADGLTVNHIARWNGSSWTAVGGGIHFDGLVNVLAVYDDGSGEQLYAGGSFAGAGGVTSNHIARWNGSSWASVGGGIDPFAEVRALAVYDDGAGAALYVGGYFSSAGGLPASHVARWDGASWSALGAGVDGPVVALAVFDDGGGPALHVGGSFVNAGGAPASRVARWDGTGWSALGSGVAGSSANALTVLDDGGGPALYVGGSFTTAGGLPASRIARWDGLGWSALGDGTDDPVYALAAFDDGRGPALFAAGRFESAGGRTALHTGRWDGSAWESLGGGFDGEVRSLAVLDVGTGPALCAGGEFGSVAGVAASRVAAWNGVRWSPLGDGLDGTVLAQTVLDDGAGPALYAGGSFTASGALPVSRVARWDGTTWAPLGAGTNGNVLALAAYDDGAGPRLYAGGSFTTAGGVPASYVAKWDGSSWSAVGGGTNHFVRALTVWDDGGGAKLYAGGSFTNAGGTAAKYVASWNGSSWSPLGAGVSSSVLSLVPHDDGAGPALYAGGYFTSAGSIAASRVARWNGSAWSALGAGANGIVLALGVFDDGGGPALFAGGDFSAAGGIAANRAASWDGSAWSSLGGGVNGWVLGFTVFGDALYAAGLFTSALDSGDSHVARWGCPDVTPPTLTCPAPVHVLDHRNDGPGEVVRFTVTAADDQDPSPTVLCTPPSGSVFPRGTTRVHCTASDASGNQATCSFSVSVEADAAQRGPTAR